jgi:hypothetical protein
MILTNTPSMLSAVRGVLEALEVQAGLAALAALGSPVVMV